MGKTAEAIAEGVSIASAAARLAIRNRILVETIAHDEAFDVVAFTPFARETLLGLADEQEQAAALVKRQRKKAWGKFTDPDGTHDYRDRDTRNLRRRQRQYVGVSKELRRRADDPDAIRAPRRASSRDTSAPMPLAAPVTTVVLPRTSSRCILAIAVPSASSQSRLRFSPTRGEVAATGRR